MERYFVFSLYVGINGCVGQDLDRSVRDGDKLADLMDCCPPSSATHNRPSWPRVVPGNFIQAFQSSTKSILTFILEKTFATAFYPLNILTNNRNIFIKEVTDNCFLFNYHKIGSVVRIRTRIQSPDPGFS